MYLEGPYQISMMERFAKIVNGQKLSVTFQKNFIIDVWWRLKYVSVFYGLDN